MTCTTITLKEVILQHWVVRAVIEIETRGSAHAIEKNITDSKDRSKEEAPYLRPVSVSVSHAWPAA